MYGTDKAAVKEIACLKVIGHNRLVAVETTLFGCSGMLV